MALDLTTVEQASSSSVSNETVHFGQVVTVGWRIILCDLAAARVNDDLCGVAKRGLNALASISSRISVP